jgi:hypothetical protein
MLAAPAIPPPMSDPAALVAIARAAHLTGDRALERAARRLLRESHGIDLSCRRRAGEGAARAN